MRPASPEVFAAVPTAAPYAAAFLGGLRVPPGWWAEAALFTSATGLWMLMMVVMMLPPVYPWLRGFAVLSRDMQSGAVQAVWIALFGLGYLSAWLCFSVVGASLQLGLRAWGLGGELPTAGFGGAGAVGTVGATDTLAEPLASLVLVGAGVYQVAPAKRACLKHCRSPMSYFLTRWRGGPTGALRMGLSHGVYCVGCCWALMLTGFALGLMNLAWMAALAALIAVETLAPDGERIGKLAGAALIVWGIASLLLSA